MRSHFVVGVPVRYPDNREIPWGLLDEVLQELRIAVGHSPPVPDPQDPLLADAVAGSADSYWFFLIDIPDTEHSELRRWGRFATERLDRAVKILRVAFHEL